MTRREFLVVSAAFGSVACVAGPGAGEAAEKPVSDVTVFAEGAGEYFPEGARLEVLGEGYVWSEGPTWDRAREALYFTDVPANVAYAWREGEGVSVFLEPSGAPAFAGASSPGANGLWYARDGSLIVSNHGARALERMDIATGERTTLTDRFGGARYSSPNDVVEASDGTLYFTDPPYGLEGLDESPIKQTAVNGVYRLSPDGEVAVLLEDMSFPNGVALSPDGGTLYIAQSDQDAPILRALDLASGEARTLFDFAPWLAEGLPGLPDGLAVAGTGEIFVTGPGGVYLLGEAGELLARVETGVATANCAFGGADGSTLFITAHTKLLRIPTRLRGVQWG